MDVDQRSDEELARLVGGGDEGAFGEIYRRYFGPVYDFALRVTRDRNVAALVVQASFLRAYQTLRSGEEPAPVRILLFAGARYDAHEQLRGRREVVPEGDEAFAIADPSRLSPAVPQADLPELARAAWHAAGGLREDGHHLLDLSARQGLDEAELAGVFRLRQDALDSRMARARAEFEQSFAAYLLHSRGRRECLDLDFLVGSEEWSSSLERRIARHLETCPTCQSVRGRFPSAADTYAALLPVPAPEGWQEIILERLQEAARSGALASAPALAPVPPPRRPAQPVPVPAVGGFGDWLSDFFRGGSGRGPLLIGFGGGLLILILVLGGLCAGGAFDAGDGGGSTTVTPTITITGTITTTGTPSATPTVTGTLTAPPLPTSTPAPPTATGAPATNTPPPAPTNTRVPTSTPVPTSTVPGPTPPP